MARISRLPAVPSLWRAAASHNWRMVMVEPMWCSVTGEIESTSDRVITTLVSK
jgi:hypothetical protein